ncbi:LacI family transcriptional regulator [Paenibacillus sp. BIHB 4019]|uniref:LacI family transcriptional regulator n=1 Tax=Paenibacillus sp. BIHB 4019 TaxID=1870819 RepID=A0A1B2DJB5_9BACL|nr:LacI family DNA-binding transcriptional regulator [Paenibacillus sp. BIHB 4019]ANY67814.1 LacI family transcriptional regulator [Paenibacillus sp. BIHB 4019]
MLALVSRKEVASLAGVSEATVSRVLNKVGPIREETRLRVEDAAKQLGYVPSALAQQFARSRSGNLGVILPFVPKVHLFSTYYFAEILSGIGEAAKQYGYDVLLIFREPSGSRDYARLFLAQKIDACIVLGAQNVPEEKKALAELQEKGYPFCLVNQRFAEEGYLSIDADHHAGSYEAVKHLIDGGSRRIAFLNGPDVFSSSMDRMTGYKQALAYAGLAYDPSLTLLGNYSRKSGVEAAEAVAALIRSGQADAVFAANDRMAIGLMDGLRAYGIEAGIDVKLVGYDDSEGSVIVSPKLTTVAVPFYEMGRRAAQRLLAPEKELLEQAEEGLLPVHLIKRETSS